MKTPPDFRGCTVWEIRVGVGALDSPHCNAANSPKALQNATLPRRGVEGAAPYNYYTPGNPGVYFVSGVFLIGHFFFYVGNTAPCSFRIGMPSRQLFLTDSQSLFQIFQ